MYKFKGTNYTDVMPIDRDGANICLANDVKVYKVGSKLFTGDVRTVKLLASDMGETAVRVKSVDFDKELAHA